MIELSVWLLTDYQTSTHSHRRDSNSLVYPLLYSTETCLWTYSLLCGKKLLLLDVHGRAEAKIICSGITRCRQTCSVSPYHMQETDEILDHDEVVLRKRLHNPLAPWNPQAALHLCEKHCLILQKPDIPIERSINNFTIHNTPKTSVISSSVKWA